MSFSFLFLRFFFFAYNFSIWRWSLGVVSQGFELFKPGVAPYDEILWSMLFGIQLCPYAHRVAIALAEKGALRSLTSDKVFDYFCSCLMK